MKTMGNANRKLLSILVLISLILTLFLHVSTTTLMFGPLVLRTQADSNCANNNTAWHNSTYLNVTIESKFPRILWYDFQKCTSYNGTTAPSDGETWESKRNAMIEVDNETWYRFVINVSSDQGWDNIDWINITSWHDNGTLDSSTGDEYNTSSNLGANRNFFLKYENLSGTGYYNLSYPLNNTEVTLGRWTEDVVSDPLGITGTETHNLTFQFRPGYQFRYASGPGEGEIWTNFTVGNNGGYPLGDHFDPVDGCWEALNNSWSWNFNMTVFNAGENWEESQYRAWVHDEFGVYSYTEIVSANNALIEGAPDARKYSTNSSSHFNQVTYGGDGNSHNVTVRTRSNGNYTLAVKVPDLIHIANDSTSQNLFLDNKYIYVRGGTRTEAINYTNTGRNYIYLYGNGSGDGTLGGITTWESHEVNGTSKYTGENGDDGFSENYPNHYASSTYNGHNDVSHYVEYSALIPYGQWPGKYSTNVYYHLRTETN